MAPSVRPAARLSERPFFPAVEIRRVASRSRVDSSAGDERSREAPISRVPPGVVRLRGDGKTVAVARRPRPCSRRSRSTARGSLSPSRRVVGCATNVLDLRSGEATRRT